jgi:hypothetical protein
MSRPAIAQARHDQFFAAAEMAVYPLGAGIRGA